MIFIVPYSIYCIFGLHYESIYTLLWKISETHAAPHSAHTAAHLGHVFGRYRLYVVFCIPVPVTLY